MAITDAQAAALGFLVMDTEDMYTVGALAPPADPRITAGWTILAYVTAHDALFPAPGAANRQLAVDPTSRVFFGCLARSNTDPTSHVVTVRGTDGIVEWIIDAEFALIPHPRHPGTQVEQGFWNIYQTMSLADPQTGATIYQNAAEGIAKLVGTNNVVVAGHSLGSALATYLTDDVAERLGAKVSACLFASPRTGDAAWANLFAATVADYRLFNYILDIVPHLPQLGYATLPNATVIQPSAAQAGINLDILCNHHVLCYCAMIDYTDTEAAPTTSEDASSKACILGPASTVPELAIVLAAIINEFGVGDSRVVAILKALYAVRGTPNGPAAIVGIARLR
jgi:triacylglycerol lipase